MEIGSNKWKLGVGYGYHALDNIYEVKDNGLTTVLVFIDLFGAL
jgi:hypothetical protein